MVIDGAPYCLITLPTSSVLSMHLLACCWWESAGDCRHEHWHHLRDASAWQRCAAK
jgi:hypothetical protein